MYNDCIKAAKQCSGCWREQPNISSDVRARAPAEHVNVSVKLTDALKSPRRSHYVWSKMSVLWRRWLAKALRQFRFFCFSDSLNFGECGGRVLFWCKDLYIGSSNLYIKSENSAGLSHLSYEYVVLILKEGHTFQVWEVKPMQNCLKPSFFLTTRRGWLLWFVSYDTASLHLPWYMPSLNIFLLHLQAQSLVSSLVEYNMTFSFNCNMWAYFVQVIIHPSLMSRFIKSCDGDDKNYLRFQRCDQ